MKTTQKGTEGILNKVCERYGINQKRRTISIQKLIRYHKPKTKAALLKLIETHHKDNEKCECGCVANGNVDTWAANLYEAYKKYAAKVGNVPYKNLEDCKIFMNYLFIEGSIKGGEMEKEALRIIKASKKIKDLGVTVKMGSQEHDFKYAVDLVLYHNKEEVMGIQVKPTSYKNFRGKDPVVLTNKKKNNLYGKPVLYLYYDKYGKFTENDTFNSDLFRILAEYKSKLIPMVSY